MQLTIPARAEYIALCRLALSGIGRARPLPEEVLADLKLALTEAASNSVRHAYADGGGGNNEYRDIPTTGGKHDPSQIESKYYGYTIGNWQGDTLVLDSINFVDSTWLARGGFFHSDRMRVIEKLTRKGNEILYEVTVEDPEVLAEPWVMTPKVLRYGGPGQVMPERNHCEVYELDDIATQIRH